MTEEHSEKDPVVYELGYHILPTVPAEDLEEETTKLRSTIEKRGGSFIAEGTPESTNLTYTMYVNEGGKRTPHNRAYFGWFKFEMNPAEVEALGTEVRDNKSVLRHILFTTTREETRAQLQTEQHGVLREVRTSGTLEKRSTADETSGEVSEEAIAKSIDDLVGKADAPVESRAGTTASPTEETQTESETSEETAKESETKEQ